MCHRAAEWCSWKYIICNFSCVNIAGSLVKQRDKLFWERKCCLLFWKQGKKFPSTPGKCGPFSSPGQWEHRWRNWTNDGPYVGCLSPTLLRQPGKSVTERRSLFLIQMGWFGFSLISNAWSQNSLDPYNWVLSTAPVFKCAFTCKNDGSLVLKSYNTVLQEWKKNGIPYERKEYAASLL